MLATNASIEGSDVQVFDDVPVGHTMFEDINKAYAIGITKGTGDGSKFEPYRDVTREEYATMNASGSLLLSGIHYFSFNSIQMLWNT